MIVNTDVCQCSYPITDSLNVVKQSHLCSYALQSYYRNRDSSLKECLDLVYPCEDCSFCFYIGHQAVRDLTDSVPQREGQLPVQSRQAALSVVLG